MVFAFWKEKDWGDLDDPIEQYARERGATDMTDISRDEESKVLYVDRHGPIMVEYHWERGKAKPRRKQVAAIASIRGMGKKEALIKLGGR
jgi:hypothetical protein